MRRRIIRTLLYKEALRYRYNWGLLVMVVALLALAGLISVSARMGLLPGQGDSTVSVCYVIYDSREPNAPKWFEYLKNAPRPSDLRVEFYDCRSVSVTDMSKLDEHALFVGLLTNYETSTPWAIHYAYRDTALKGAHKYRDWINNESRRYFHHDPYVVENSWMEGEEAPKANPVPVVVTALTIFALYLLSFNLFITSTGEEREKRVLLGLMLTPASAAEVIVAKAVFYGTFSLALSLATVAMYRPVLLLKPLLWTTVLLGSICYVAIGTVIVSLVRRQTTINTVSMLYLIATSIVMFLAQFLPVFNWLRRAMIEDYLYRQVHQIVAGDQPWWTYINQAILCVLAFVWCVIAIEIFKRRSMAIAHGR